MFTDFLINIDYLIKKKIKNFFFRVFWVQQGWISRFLLYLLISTCFVANKKPQFLKTVIFDQKCWFFDQKLIFLAILSPNNIKHALYEYNKVSDLWLVSDLWVFWSALKFDWITLWVHNNCQHVYCHFLYSFTIFWLNNEQFRVISNILTIPK